jgi:hypothetical protein
MLVVERLEEGDRTLASVCGDEPHPAARTRLKVHDA